MVIEKIAEQKNELFTIGYGAKTIEQFIFCLLKNKITFVIDVRSTPFSKSFPIFNKNDLENALQKEGIQYSHFGSEFGARRQENSVYKSSYSLKGEFSSQVIFDEIFKLEVFQNGISKTRQILDKNNKVAFLCSEKYPYNCHRFIMVAYYFSTLGYSVQNIVDEKENMPFDSVMAYLEKDFNIQKEKFYKVHEEELNPYQLIPACVPNYVQWWDDFFNMNIGKKQKLMKFANYQIG